MFSWHYQFIGLSLLIMICLLITLIKIADLLNQKKLTATQQLTCKIPFGVYFGWITVATIANVTTFLVSIGWKDLVFPDEFWMVLVQVVGLIIAVWRTWKDNNLAYGMVPAWAYYGIFLQAHPKQPD